MVYFVHMSSGVVRPRPSRGVRACGLQCNARCELMHTNRPMRILHLCVRSGLATLLAIGVLGFCSVRTPAQDTMEKGHRKAIFLHNILTFVQWTDADPPASFELCVANPNHGSPSLAQELRGNMFDGAKVRVRQVRTRADFKGCRAVVLEGSDSNQVVRQFSVPKGTNLITFGD